MAMEFNTDAEIVLEDERVLLRRLRPEDKEHLLPFSIYEPELWTYSLIPGNGEDNLDAYLNAAFEQQRIGTAYPFIVYDKLKEAYAGSTRFYDIQRIHEALSLGYTWYGKEFQGTGLNKHCKYLLLEYAFENLYARRVEFRADAKNIRSIAAMKSIGCVEEGILRDNCASPSGRRDSIVLSILADEWYASVRENLQKRLR